MVNFKAFYNLLLGRKVTRETKIDDLVGILNAVNSISPQEQHIIASVVIDAGYRRVLI